ncbi:MAG: excinuclease ABC subunit UvrC [Candidatus Omnitrophica bacterium]|nr:excinuclease ABC subunit UvrC [Candidatus Omnitrophota bacterium]
MDKEKLKNIPDLPGVYIMKDNKGGILYIGKAASLKNRVLSYFRDKANISQRIGMMAGKADDIAFFVTGSEAEALILEAAFIKKHKPRYNVALKDDKSYPYLELTENEDFPRLIVTRRRGDSLPGKDGGSVFYGPYTDVKLLRRALGVMKRIFPLRTCRRMSKKSCLNYRIGQCYAPCIGAIDKNAYSDIAEELKMFLSGDRLGLIESLSEKMRKAAAIKDYEKAALLRDRITALSVVPKIKIRITHYDEIEELRHLLRLRRPSRRIEAFDISNISGKEAAGSMVTFIDGKPNKDHYRRFKIRSVKGINDYEMMSEIVRRRYERVKKERLPSPDLVIIDGGKGHLNAAASVLSELGFGKLPVIGIAKKFEHIYLKGRKEPIIFSHNSPILHLIQRLRDEAHRFAISYHRVLRRKKIQDQFAKLDGKG